MTYGFIGTGNMGGALARAAALHQEDVRHLEETAGARERERRKQRDTFF